ncbi:hypothetical protein V491_04012 [Pseudogymnoascus sp. VKM F-3775]|nr:hypothetical protein V491_04012 [Pseudogymnoascus sp. VKM F-3775]
MAPNQYPVSEGLQVVPAHEGLQVAPVQPGLELYSDRVEKIDKAGVAPYDNGLEVAPSDGLEGFQPAHKRSGTICGLRRRTFAIIAGIIVVAVIVAAILINYLFCYRRPREDVDDVNARAVRHQTPPSPAHQALPALQQRQVLVLPNRPLKNPSLTNSSSASHTTTSSHSTTTTSTGPIPTSSLYIDCPKINATSRALKSTKSGTAYDFDLYCNANFASGHDIGNKNATSLNECIQGCIELIELGATCVGVVWDSILNLPIGHNCFLKNSLEGGLQFSSNYGTHPGAAIYQADGGTYD